MKGFSCLQMTRVLMMHCGPQQDLAEVHTRLVAQTGGLQRPLTLGHVHKHTRMATHESQDQLAYQ